MITKTATKARGTAAERVTCNLSDDECVLVCQALSIARDTLGEIADKAERVYPTSLLVERWRMVAEQMEDLRARLDS